MKKFVVLIFVVCFCSSAAAAVIHLKNGSQVTGEILERTNERVRVDVSGVKLTYYSDEIVRIEDGTAPVQSVSSAAASVAASPDLPPQTAASEAISADKKELILKFIDLFGTRSAMSQNLDQMLASLPPEQSEAFRKAFKIEEIIDLLAPLYDKYFDQRDLQEYVRFYSSAAGRKLVENIPNIMKESVGISSSYFEKNMPPEIQK